MKITIPTLFLATLVTGCSINSTVQPIPANTQLSPLCIEENTQVLMDGFLPELREQIERKGIPTKVYSTHFDLPTDCYAAMIYTANWRWDFVMWLTYANIRVFANNQEVGRAEYDARWGVFRLDKFGPTSGKLESIIDPLFMNVTRKQTYSSN